MGRTLSRMALINFQCCYIRDLYRTVVRRFCGLMMKGLVEKESNEAIC